MSWCWPARITSSSGRSRGEQTGQRSPTRAPRLGRRRSCGIAARSVEGRTAGTDRQGRGWTLPRTGIASARRPRTPLDSNLTWTIAALLGAVLMAYIALPAPPRGDPQARLAGPHGQVLGHARRSSCASRPASTGDSSTRAQGPGLDRRAAAKVEIVEAPTEPTATEPSRSPVRQAARHPRSTLAGRAGRGDLQVRPTPW